MITKILQSFGLNQKQRLVFTKVMELGTQPASNIARVTDLPRNSVRFILDELVKMGLLVKSNRGNTQYYTVERKDNIVRHLKVRQLHLKEQLDTQIKLVEEFGSELNPHAHAASSRRPKITFYEGTDGLEKVYEHTLSAKKYIRSWANFDGMHEALPEYFATYYKRRHKKKIAITSIHPDSEMARYRKTVDKEEGRESVIVPPEKYTWVSGIRVYDNFINITSWSEKLGIIIESPELAKSLASIFDLSAQAARDEEAKYEERLKKEVSWTFDCAVDFRSRSAGLKGVKDLHGRLKLLG